MDEQKTLTLDFIKSLMEPAYTLVWTDYDDNLDNHRGLIQKCLDSKSREHLWEEADVWYSDAEWEAVRGDKGADNAYGRHPHPGGDAFQL